MQKVLTIEYHIEVLVKKRGLTMERKNDVLVQLKFEKFSNFLMEGNKKKSTKNAEAQ